VVSQLPKELSAGRLQYAVNLEQVSQVTDEQLEVLTWLITDGCLFSSSEGKKRLQWKLSKPRKIDALEKVLNKYEIPYTKRVCKKTGINKLQPYYIRVYGEYARKVFRWLDGVKEYPAVFTTMNRRQCEKFIEVLEITDGSRSKNTVQMTTVNRKDADTVQTCMVLNGIACSVDDMGIKKSGFKNGKVQYMIKIKDCKDFTKNSGKPVSITESTEGSTVVGIETITGRLLTRRNGKVVVTGNCTDTSERRSNLVKYVQAGIKIHGLTTYKDAWLSHCPIHPQEMRKKNLNVCGHLHLNNVMHIDQEGNLDLRYFNVSCENIDYTPISYNQILERVNYE
jgi:hypothetical protein